MWSVYMSNGGDWEWHDWSVKEYAGLEVWNAYYPHNYNTNYSIAAFNKWDELNNRGMHLYGITNTDAHTSNIGNPNGGSLGLGYGWTTVYTDLVKDSILNALKIGRHYGSNGPIIDFKINDKMMGSDVGLTNGKLNTIYLLAKDEKNPIQTVKLVKNGQVFKTWQPNSQDWAETLEKVEAKEGDFFRMTAEGNGNWQYLNGTQTCPSKPVRTGTLNFPKLANDTYIIRFLAYGSPDLDMQMADSVVITVGPTAIENSYSNSIKGLKTLFFNNRTKYLSLTLSLAMENSVTLDMYSLSGKKVTTLMNNKLLKSGNHHLLYEVLNIASGSYIFKINIGSSIVVRKIGLLN